MEFTTSLSNKNNTLTLEDIAKHISKPLVIRYDRVADVDGLSANLKLLSDFHALEQSLKNKDYKIINVTYYTNYIQIDYFQGYRDAEAIEKYYNMDLTDTDNFNNIIKVEKDNINEINYDN